MNRNAKVLQFKSRQHQVNQISLDRYEVISGTSGSRYTVRIHPDGPRCSCDFQIKRKSAAACACSHTLAVLNHIAQSDGRRVSAWGSEQDAARQHRATVATFDGLTVTSRLAA
jgi:hypothetical protein